MKINLGLYFDAIATEPDVAVDVGAVVAVDVFA